MKKLLVLVALLAMAALPMVAQSGPITGPYLVDYFSNTAAADQSIRLVNFGANGTPLTSPTGDVCANIYVFDANQEMIECCSCRITPNGVLRFSLGVNSFLNDVTGVIPTSGDVKILSTNGTGTTCSPVTLNAGLTDSLVGFGSHNQVAGIPAAVFQTETQIPAAALSGQEQAFLTQTCQFIRYLGSGFGICSCANRG